MPWIPYTSDGRLPTVPRRYSLARIAAPSGDVVSLTEAKAHLRITGTHEDAAIADMVAAATEQLDARDGILGRALLTQDWAMTIPAIEVPRLGRRLTLPFPPVAAIVSVVCYDTGGALRTFPPASYRLVADNDHAWLELDIDARWPDMQLRDDALTVTWRCGYGVAADVPVRLKRAILMDTGTQYRMREGHVVERGVLFNLYHQLTLPYIVHGGLA